MFFEFFQKAFNSTVSYWRTKQLFHQIILFNIYQQIVIIYFAFFLRTPKIWLYSCQKEKSVVIFWRVTQVPRIMLSRIFHMQPPLLGTKDFRYFIIIFYKIDNLKCYYYSYQRNRNPGMVFWTRRKILPFVIKAAIVTQLCRLVKTVFTLMFTHKW